MENSIFQNFSVEYLRSSAVPDVGLKNTPFLFLLINDALNYCAKLTFDTDGRLKGSERATDESLEAIAIKINELADIALQKGDEPIWSGFADNLKNNKDCTVFAIAIDELGSHKNSDVSFLQINGIAALWLIDNAITAVKKRKASRRFVESLAEAALYLSQAASHRKDLHVLSAENAESSRKDVERDQFQI